MALSCNIDRRGKIARLIYGIILVALGIVLIVVWAWPSAEIWKWLIAVVCVAAGAFGIFEAAVGWCAVRAMGFKTPM